MSKTRSRFARKASGILAAIALVLGVSIGTLAVNPSPASASATGCTHWGGIPVSYRGITMHIPTGQYCFSIKGSGTRIDNTRGSWNSGWMVSPAEIVRFYDRWGNHYATYRTYSAPGIQAGGYHGWNTGINGHAKAGGRACGTLYSSGTEVAKACLNIY